MVRTQVQFTTAQVKRLRATARAQEVSVAEVVRRCVDSSLRQPLPKRAYLYARAAGLVGAFRVGDKASLSTRHDEHLVDAFR
jgi:hypothetical protein